MSISMSLLAKDVQRYQHSFEYRVRVESWFGGELLIDEIPVSAGTLNEDRTSRVPERLSFTVPRKVDEFDWSPLGDDAHPLAANGQRLRLSLGVVIDGQPEWVQRGEYVVQNTRVTSQEVQVEALGLLALIEEARLVAPYQPTGTLKSTIRKLVEPAITVVFDAALSDRSVPAGINFDEDRIGALEEVLNAWPAEASMSSNGYLYVYPVKAPAALDSVYNFYPESHALATHVDIGGDSSREGAINCVVARGTASDGGQVQAVAYDTSGGPHHYGGSFNPLPVPEFFASPLLTTTTQCKSAAQTRLAKKQREHGRPIRITCPPVLWLEKGDVVAVDLDDTPLTYCSIEALTLPLIPDGNPMELVVVGTP